MTENTNNEDSLKKTANLRGKNKRNNDLSSYMFGKVQPQALPLEEAVLGALMLDKDALTVVIDILRPESFYMEAHQIIFKCIMKLFEKLQPVDLLTVTEEVKKEGALEKIGGAYYLVELTNRVASAANIEFHARIIAQKHIQRELIRISTTVIQDAYEDTTDVFDLLDKAEQGLFEITEQNLSRGSESMSALVSKAVKQIEDMAGKEAGLTGVPSGFAALDRVTSGWQSSDLIIVAARPGMGKTSYTLALARNAAMDFGKGVAFFSLEMSNVQLVQRLISMEAEIPGSKLRNGQLEDYEWQQLNSAIEKLSEAPIFIDDTPGINVFELRAKCRRLKMQHDIQMVIIDYLQLMTGGSDQKGNREQEISMISRSLKGLAKELNVPVIALSQLSRAVETRGGAKRPQLSDLRECITGDTLIYLPKTGEYKPVAELEGQNGFEVLAMDENYKLQPAKCLDVWKTGAKEIYEIETQSGNKIRASLNHPFFTIGGWQQVVDLKVGDIVAMAKSLCENKNAVSIKTKALISNNNELLEKSEIIQNLVDAEDIKWDKIKTITHVGNEETYDIHVENHHNFVANDFIIHNSGAIEQDADIVSFIYRPDYYQIMEDEEGNSLKDVGEIIIAKHRNGSLETIKLKFTPHFAKFSNLEDPDFANFEDNEYSPGIPQTLPSKMNRPDTGDGDIPF